MKEWLFSTGIEHQPGPDSDFKTLPSDIVDFDNIPSHAILLESINVTCLETNLEEVISSKADFSFLQETSATPATVSAIKNLISATGKKVDIGCLDPTTKAHNVGGVGACAKKQPHRLISMAPKSEVFKEAVANGRAAHYGIGTIGGKVISIFVNYGYSGAAGSKKQVKKTNQIFEAIIEERKLIPCGPAAIVGDYNGDPPNFKGLQRLLIKEGWTDFGADAHRWNQTRNEYTCVTKNALKPHRRDFICGNAEFDVMATGGTKLAMSTLVSPKML